MVHWPERRLWRREQRSSQALAVPVRQLAAAVPWPRAVRPPRRVAEEEEEAVRPRPQARPRLLPVADQVLPVRQAAVLPEAEAAPLDRVAVRVVAVQARNPVVSQKAARAQSRKQERPAVLEARMGQRRPLTEGLLRVVAPVVRQPQVRVQPDLSRAAVPARRVLDRQVVHRLSVTVRL